MGKTKSSFRGKTRKNADLRKRSNSFSYLKLPDGVEVFTPEIDSKIDMDIMPYLVTDKKHPDKDVEAEIAIPGSYWYKRPFKTHRSIGAQPRSYVCPSSFGKKCYICEYREKLRKEEGDEEELKALKTSDRNLYAIILRDRKNPKSKGKVYVLDTSDFLFQEKFEDQLSDHEEFEIFPDHKEGYTLRVRFVENSFGGNKFAEPSRFDFIERETQYPDSILEQIPNLDECLEVLSYEDLKDKFLENLTGGVDDEDDDENEDEEDEKPVKKGKTPVKKSKPKQENEDEDEDDDQEEDEDLDEDDDQEEDEDDEEDEKSVSRKRKSAAVEKPKAKSTKELTCPSKHKFGKDTDKFDDCDDCKIWNECYAAKKGK
jgi:hypothetical protein